MPAWLKKIALDIMPSVAATIIGAYIVNYYIIPKSPSAFTRAAMASTDSKPVDALASDKATPASDKATPVSDKAATEKDSFERAVADKAAIEKTAAKAAADKIAADRAAGTEPRKPAPKAAAKTVSVVTAETSSDEHRGSPLRATDLARAAIERLRGGGHADATKPELLTPSEAPRVQTVSTVAAPTISPMQPLPPAVSVAAPNADVFEQGNAVAVVRQPYPQTASRADESRRFAPPADIPVSRPMDLRADASARSLDRTGSVADEMASVAKSLFHAVIPR